MSHQANVLMDRQVLEKINLLIHQDPSHECGGIFIGNISKDEITGTYTVHLHDLYYEDRKGSRSTFEFTTDYLMNAVKYVKKHYPHYHIVGNVHSHAQFDAFWSSQDVEMMQQSRDNSFYMVVSCRYGTWNAVFKDMDFHYYACQVSIADDQALDHLFDKRIERKEAPTKVTYRTQRHYSDVQKRELDKRFLHSVTELSDKKMLIIGAGTIGNLLSEYAMQAGIGHLCIVDKDDYHYWNLPRSSMIDEHAQEKHKALALAKALSEKCYFPLEVTGIHADICALGWGFFEDFDLILSPVDNAAIRQYVDRGCKLYHIPHITCGTGIVDGDFTGNILFFPENAVVDLEYIWGNGYRQRLEERRSCADIAEETQAQVMSFSSQIAGMSIDLALKVLLGQISDDKTVYKYILNALGHGYARDKVALRTFKYSQPHQSELYEIFDPQQPIAKIRFDRSLPKRYLWEKLNILFKENIYSYRLNLEWSLNIPIAYDYANALAKIEVSMNSGVDAIFDRLPDRHIYYVEGEKGEYLVEITFEGGVNDETGHKGSIKRASGMQSMPLPRKRRICD